ncbi:MAG: outer membrane protein assembly factor BamA [Gemmatimonadetes bacterium]|nr:outer membrane protein assembly factor BamA [Gemmatimonadota bacterium]
MGPVLGRVVLLFRRILRGAIALVALTAVFLPGQESSTLRAQEPPLAAPAAPVTIDSIDVRGNRRLTDVQVISQSGLRVGQSVRFPEIQDALRRLFASGAYEDVSVSVTPGSPAIFFIDVVERPFLVDIEFRGLKNVSERAIRDTTGLFRGTAYDPAKVLRAETAIETRLANDGFPQATADSELVPAGIGPNQYRLVFTVDEGPRLGVARISFEGNEHYPDADLRGAMATGEEGFLWYQAGELKRDEFRQDLTARLPAFYAERGFIEFGVIGDSIIVDRTTGKGEIMVRVDEGPRYYLKEFEVTGNRRFPTALLKQFYRQAALVSAVDEDGKLLSPIYAPFDAAAFEEGAAEVADLYRNAGYMRSAIVPSVEKLPPDSVGGSPMVIARWNIREGEPTYVRQLTIVGNDYTHDRVIRQRISLLPGDVFAQARLINSIQAIHALNFFEPLPPQEQVRVIDRPDGDVDIVIRVQEKQTGNVNFGVSAAGAFGFSGFVGYNQPNLFGKAKNGSFRFVFGGRQQDIELTYTDPQVFWSRYSVTVGLRSSRDQFTNVSLGIRRVTGGFTEVGFPLPLRSTRGFIGYSLFNDRTTNLDLSGIGPNELAILSGTRSTISSRIVRDVRNNPVFPTAGNLNTLSARFVGGPLGGDGDYTKWEFASEWWVPVARLGGGFQTSGIEIAAGIKFGGGWIVGSNVFFQERFQVGGTQVGQQLRGYEEATVTPLGHVPRNAPVSDLDRVGNSYFTTTAQIGMKLTNQVFFSTFMDAGNNWFEPGAFNPTDLLVGAGVGVSLITPFGPIGLDYAYGFDRRDVLGRPDPGWKLHFKFGRIF